MYLSKYRHKKREDRREAVEPSFKTSKFCFVEVVKEAL